LNIVLTYANSGWVSNTDLVDMDVSTVGNVSSSMRKDLASAHALAAEQHDLEFYKEIFMEQKANDLEEKEALKAAKKAEKAEKAANKTKRKSKATITDEDAEGDIDMIDAPAELDEDAEAPSTEKKKTKKRKATDDGEVSQIWARYHGRH
jgi:asparagine synthetase B (glutamine-hydrolysing)